MSTSAHERRCYLANNSARDIANSLFQKWAIKGFFPAGERSEPRSRTAPKGLPQTEARDAQRGGPSLESPCRTLSLVLSFASKESTIPRRGGSPTARAGVGASFPQLGFPYGRVVLRSSFRPLPPSGHPGSRLSHRDRDDASTNALDTFLRVIIGTAHTAVRSACCLPSFF